MINILMLKIAIYVIKNSCFSKKDKIMMKNKNNLLMDILKLKTIVI
jgi:hypothetical protein